MAYWWVTSDSHSCYSWWSSQFEFDAHPSHSFFVECTSVDRLALHMGLRGSVLRVVECLWASCMSESWTVLENFRVVAGEFDFVLNWMNSLYLEFTIRSWLRLVQVLCSSFTAPTTNVAVSGVFLAELSSIFIISILVPRPSYTLSMTGHHSWITFSMVIHSSYYMWQGGMN